MRSRDVVLGLAAVVLAAGLAWFEPWRLVTSSTIDEAAPTSTVAPDPTGLTSASTPDLAAPRDTVLARGSFESAEHATSGDVVVLALADGRRFVRLEELATSDGPTCTSG